MRFRKNSDVTFKCRPLAALTLKGTIAGKFEYIHFKILLLGTSEEFVYI